MNAAEVTDEYQFARLKPIYYIKPDGTKKMRITLRGDQVDSSDFPAYSGVVRPDTMRMVVAIAKRLGLQQRKSDIKSAFINARNAQKVLTRATEEIGIDVAKDAYGDDAVGSLLAIEGALEGLIHAGRSFNKHLAEKLVSIGFARSLGDENAFWRRNPDGSVCFVLAHVDDVLMFATNGDALVGEVEALFDLSGTGEMGIYLGMDLARMGSGDISISSENYIVRTIPELEEEFGDFREYDCPTSGDGDHPELDDSETLDTAGKLSYQKLIGIQTYLSTATRPDISYAVCSLARFSHAPRRGHMALARRVMGYLKRHPSLAIPASGESPNIDVLATPPIEDDLHLYGEMTDADANTDYPPAVPDTELEMVAFVDADFAHDKVTSRSISGEVIYLGGALVSWSAKRQTTVATSTFASEYNALKRVVETVRALRFTLRSLGIEVTRAAKVFCDNLGTVKSATLESTALKARHELVAYHAVRSAVASGLVTINHVASEDNRADLLTKGFARMAHARLVGLLMVAPDGEQEDADG